MDVVAVPGPVLYPHLSGRFVAITTAFHKNGLTIYTHSNWALSAEYKR